MRKDWLKMARVLGICPTIDSPIKSNDGYLIRFRPKYGYLSSKQLSILADAISSFGSNFTYAWKKAFRPASTRTDYYPVWSADPITDSSGNVYQMNTFYNATDTNKREMFVIKRNSSGPIQWLSLIHI